MSLLGEPTNNRAGLGAVTDSDVDTTRYSDLESQTQELLETQNRLASEAESAAETIQQKESKIQTLQNEVKTIASSISEAKQIKSQAQNQLPKMSEAKNILSQLRNSNFSQVRTPAKELYGKVTDAISDLQSMVSNMNDYISSRNTTESDITDEINLLDSEIAELKSKDYAGVIDDPAPGGGELELIQL